jgi:hypothetical protein
MLKDKEDIPLLLEGKKSSLDGIYLPMQLTDWPLIKVALLLIGLIPYIQFDPLGKINRILDRQLITVCKMIRLPTRVQRL